MIYQAERHGTSAKNGGKGGRQIVLFPSILAAVIKHKLTTKEISISGNSSHLEWRVSCREQL
jgi:hypothetical protein